MKVACAGMVVALAAGVLAVPAGAAEQKLTASDGVQSEHVGSDVAIDGDVAVVGAPNAIVGGKASAGAVYVFKRTNGTWAQTAKLTASDGDANDVLGVSVAIQGNTIVAGADGWDDPTATDTDLYDNQGALYTFSAGSTGNATQTARLTSSVNANSGSGSFLGGSVAIDGDTIVGGAPGAHGVFVFASSGNDRTQTRILTASGSGLASSSAGSSVDISGDVVVAGAPLASDANNNQGAAYVFNASTGAQTGRLTATDGAAQDYLGTGVAISGTTVVAGAPGGFPGSFTQSTVNGKLYTFAATGAANRTQTATLTASDGDANDRLGEAVAADGNTIVAGAPNAGGGPGALYTFALTGGNRKDTGELNDTISADSFEQLGGSIDISGDSVIAGARFDQVGIQSTEGSAAVFTLGGGGADRMPPTTKVTDGPDKRTKSTKATFKFRGEDDVTKASKLKFRCKLDGGKFKGCESPQSYRHLDRGKHRFSVEAVDEAGNVDRSPASYEWKVRK